MPARTPTGWSASGRNHRNGIEGGAAVATYVGWVVPWGEPLSLIGPDEVTLAEAQIALGRIGIEPVVGPVWVHCAAGFRAADVGLAVYEAA